MARRVAVIGGGIGGLVAALELAVAGCEVTLLERQASLGGKLRVLGPRIDAGPTVFTMRWVFDEIFAGAGASFAERVPLQPARVLARHAWGPESRLDLFADLAETADAIGTFAGAKEASGFLKFSERAKDIYDTLEKPFLRAQLPTPVSLVSSGGISGLPGLLRISPFDTLGKALAKYFADPRLRQLFGRYATYSGSSPYLAPATLMLIAHVERDGVWLVQGGMYRLVEALAALAVEKSVKIRCGAEVGHIEILRSRVAGVTLADGERIDADMVVVNADPAALALKLFGEGVAAAVPPLSPRQRSQSAITWAFQARTEHFPLSRHNVFFSENYKAEFDDVFERGEPPNAPTIYVCAQDRDENGADVASAERLLCLINASADGDRKTYSQTEMQRWTQKMFAKLAQCGLRIHPAEGEMLTTAPDRFEALFPATGGALYGQTVHGSMATFRRPGAKTRIPGLYLAGGATHPGAGVPMAALSGRLAAAQALADGFSTRR
jgi:1-hydroxycarotenoid 3,4-desaturase